jgi:hypothetical protein
MHNVSLKILFKEHSFEINFGKLKLVTKVKTGEHKIAIGMDKPGILITSL